METNKRFSSKNNFFSKDYKLKINSPIPRILPNSRRGLSAVITTLILIALTIAAIAIIWVTVTNLLTSRLESTESCINIFEKVEINQLYTCYDDPNFQFSINIKDIEVDSVIVSISGAGSTKGYTLTNVDQSISGLGPYPSGSGNVKLPEKNSGLTYISSDFSSIPDSIKITPVIDGNQCEVSDSLLEIYSC